MHALQTTNPDNEQIQAIGLFTYGQSARFVPVFCGFKGKWPVIAGICGLVGRLPATQCYAPL